MKNYVWIVILLSFGSWADATNIESFESCYKERASKIPSQGEREFLDSYLVYLKHGSSVNGEKAIEKMQALAKIQGGRFSVQWASIFEGSMELCCGGPQTCTESFGSASLKALYPRVEKGWVTSIFLVLMYERLAKTDGADSSGLEDYLEVIRSKHPWGFTLFKKKYPRD